RALLRLLLVNLEGLLHGIAEADEGDGRLAVLLLPHAVAGVDVALGIHEESGPGLVPVELEEVDVHVEHRRDPQAHKVRADCADLRVSLSDILIEAPAVPSRLSAEDDEERLAGLAGLLERLRRVAVPAGVLPLGLRGQGDKRDHRERGTDEHDRSLLTCHPIASWRRPAEKVRGKRKSR